MSEYGPSVALLFVTSLGMAIGQYVNSQSELTNFTTIVSQYDCHLYAAVLPSFTTFCGESVAGSLPSRGSMHSSRVARRCSVPPSVVASDFLFGC
jgi:hypothetical protein